ncbi:MAG: flagellar basal body-associated FliL family protein [Pseudomonadota bacterium]|nr:flagellar basal body-associated FliL family protein [Pseudomonadota bacterium]HJO35473.1 flagellar basal body-associated FliL family protein [Gammaproteobacteria bacterium]
MAQAETDAEAQAKSGGGSRRWLLIGGAILLLVLINLAALWFFLLRPQPDDAAVAEGDPAAEAESPPAPVPAAYRPLDPPFVVNFDDAQGAARYLQVSVTVAALDEAALEQMQPHLPAVRNELLMLYGSQRAEALRSREAKEALRAQTLVAVQDVLSDRTGEPLVQDVFFTAFVMQ